VYLLDTNVISELRKPVGRISPDVAAWAAAADTNSLYISTITVMELELGVLRLELRRPAQAMPLRNWLERHVLQQFAGRILPVDSAVALRCAQLHVPNMRPERDAYIAATAAVHGMAVVTRNVSDFAGTGVAVINPWAA
jgi:predicted nucleic acid-binding protein